MDEYEVIKRIFRPLAFNKDLSFIARSINLEKISYKEIENKLNVIHLSTHSLIFLKIWDYIVSILHWINIYQNVLLIIPMPSHAVHFIIRYFDIIIISI